jgi:hypothetical protein
MHSSTADAQQGVVSRQYTITQQWQCMNLPHYLAALQLGEKSLFLPHPSPPTPLFSGWLKIIID